MEKKVVLAELNYIFNLIKGSFDPVALAKSLTAAGQWDKFVKDKAKSYGIKVPNDLKVEQLVRTKVKQKTNKFESESELVEDWIMAYLFLPEALDKLDVDEDTGDSFWKSRGITDVFESFNNIKEKHPDQDHSFGGWINKSVSNALSKYLKEEQRREDPFISENADSLVKNRMKNMPQKDKIKTPAEGEEDLPFGLNPGDIDKIQSIGDFRDNVRLRELTQNALKYVLKHASKEAGKVFELRLNDEYMPFDEIAEKLKKSKSTISGYLKELQSVLLDFAHEYDNGDLTRLIEKMISKTKATPKDKKAASLDELKNIMADLEGAFKEGSETDTVKIASITKYIDILCNKIS